LQHRSSALDVERGAATGSESIFRQADGLALDVRVAQRDGELPLCATKLEVGEPHRGGQRDLRVVDRMLRGLHPRALRADIPP
jgi:hypothetical protein